MGNLMRSNSVKDRPQAAPSRGGPDSCDLDRSAWVEALKALPDAQVTEADILGWIEGPLRMFFPFERFLLAYGRLSGGRVRMCSLLSSGYTAQFCSKLRQNFDLGTQGCFAWWVANRKPFVLDHSGAFGADGASISPTAIELDRVIRFSLGLVAAHGVIDPFTNGGTYVSFAGVQAVRREQIFEALELIAPILHKLFLQTKRLQDSSVDLTALTERQRQLVDLALAGLPDKTIAARLAISDHTVGNHFRAIYSKLGVCKRSQLMAMLR